MSEKENVNEEAATDKTDNNSNTENATVSQEKTVEEKLNEMNDKYLRLYSEFENVKKRHVRERVDLIKTAGEELFLSLLPVLDDFERAIKANKNIEDVKTLQEGFVLIHHKIQNVFKVKGLEEMNPAGEEFNPDLHEAITNLPVEDENKKGKIVEVVEKGYSLNGKVIRFAKVVVGA